MFYDAIRMEAMAARIAPGRPEVLIARQKILQLLSPVLFVVKRKPRADAEGVRANTPYILSFPDASCRFRMLLNVPRENFAKARIIIDENKVRYN